MKNEIEDPFARKQIFLRIGGIVAVIAGIGGIISNALHPRPPQRTDELLTLVASIPHWTIIHYGAAVSAALTVAGIALWVQTLENARARAIGEVGKYISALGAAAFLVAIMVDGYGFPYFAARWMEAGPDEKHVVLWAASAVHTVDAALFPVWSTLFLGLGILLVTIAVWCSNEYSRALAAFGTIGALMCFVYGLSRIFDMRVPLPLWPWGPAVDTIWLMWLGVAMLRKS